MSQPAAPVFDPYADEPPPWWQRHSEWLWTIAVFFFTALLTVLSFPPLNTGEFAYAFAVPAVLWAYRKPSLKRFAITVLAAQAVAWTILLSWLHHVTFLGLFLLGPFVGAWVGLWYLGAWWVVPRMLGRKNGLRIIAMLGLAGLWVLLEWTRTWVLGGFPWLPLAASQWKQVSVLQIAAFTGAYGVSFALITVNLGFAAYAHRLFFERLKGFNRRSQEFFTAMFILVVCLTVHVQETLNQRQYRTPYANIAVVQPYIPQEIKWDPSRSAGILEVLTTTSERAAATRPDFIVWPEAVTPYAIRGDDAVKTWTENLDARLGVPLLLGSVGIENKGQPDEVWRNGAFVVDPVVGLQTTGYSKRKLVPFGEFVPLRPVLGWLNKFVPIGDGDFEPGETASPLLITGKNDAYAVGPLICYEDIYPQLSRESILSGSDMLVVLTNNGWFGERGAAYQHASHAVLRAVESRRPLVRCGNGGWSGWIDEFGNIRATVTDESGSIYFRGTRTFAVTRDIRWATRHSFYTEYGDWFVAVSALLLTIGAAGLATARPIDPEPVEEEKPVFSQRT